MAKIRRRLTTKRTEVNPDSKKYERIAEIKSIIKGLDDEAKTIQAELLAGDMKAESYSTEYGTLTLRTRENWKVTDKSAVILDIGQKAFNKHATISKAGIVNAVGEAGLVGLESDGAVALSSVSEYYQLSK